MKIGILGSGCSAIFLALILKERNQNIDLTLLDMNKVPGKKFLITGNGRCNLLNKRVHELSYNNEFINKEINNEFITKEIQFFNKIGVELREIGDLVYPYSLSAETLNSYFINYLTKKGTHFINEVNIIDYKVNTYGIDVVTSNGNYSFDKLVIASGGLSKISNKQNDLLEIYSKHGYSISSLYSGLTPIKTREETKSIENIRVKGDISLYIDSKPLYKEEGEVLFKKDGLSGIAIFNIESLIKRFIVSNKSFSKALISIDLFKELSLEELINKLKKYNNLSFLDGVFHNSLNNYILYRSNVKKKNHYSNEEIFNVAKTIKNLSFTYEDSYSFKDSQVTIGGIKLSNLNNNFASNIEKGVFFIGEVVDVDGLCGGYNLMYSFYSAIKASEVLL